MNSKASTDKRQLLSTNVCYISMDAENTMSTDKTLDHLLLKMTWQWLKGQN